MSVSEVIRQAGAFFGLTKKNLSNEGSSWPIRQNYLFMAAYATISALKPINWYWTKIAKTFSVKNGQYSDIR